MTPEKQRIAIAESCGWTDISDWKAGGINGKHPTEPWTEVIPDYLHDLNAMHEAEKVLTAEQWYDYDCLMPLHPQKTHTTAAQRAKAFLRVIGKWKTNSHQ